MFLACREDVDDVEELFDSGLLFAVEHAFVEKVKTVAGCPFEGKNFGMLEESRHVLPRIPVILELLQEPTNADDNMLALDIRIADSVELEHVAPLN